MAKTRDILAVFNRGRVSKLAQARVDVARIALSADVQTNVMPRRLGPMQFRPGWEYLGGFASNNDGAYIPFVYSNTDTAILELTPSLMRVWLDGEALLTRPSVSAAVTNGSITTDLTGWTDSDESGAASTYEGGSMKLVGTGFLSARRRQTVSVTAGQENTVHALRIVVSRGPVLLRIGSTAGNDDIFRQANLRTGTHSLAFIPGGSSFSIEFSSSLKYPTYVDSCEIEAAGTVTLPTPWSTADLCKAVRWSRSGDVIFCACDGLKQRRIERRTDNSWSVVEYESNDGPFLTENVERITVTPDGISGEVTLTASRPIWREEHVGALWRITSQGQLVEASISAEATFSNEIRVTGVGTGRRFTVRRTGTWSGSVRLQRSVGAPGAWVNVATYTTNATLTYDDELDNVEAYYRIGFGAGDYTSGTANLSLEFSAGSITGVVRITDYTDSDEVDAIVLDDLGGTDATEIWAEGAWSDDRGWPQVPAVWEDRIWWMGVSRLWASIVDAFTSFDPDYEGDAGPISRLLAGGSAGNVNWALGLTRLIAGGDTKEVSIRSNSFDEPVTPSNYNAKAPTSRGSAPVSAAEYDDRGYFAGKNGRQIFELEQDEQGINFKALDTTLLIPEIGEAGFVRLAVQTAPDFRLHGVRGDGTVGVLVRDAAEDVLCWVDVETNGFVEDVCVLPGEEEDRVFYRVRRTIDGNTVRYHEKWAMESEARGGTVNKMADSFVTGTGPTTTLTGLDHLEGETVRVWADGRYIVEAEVAGGEVVLAESVTDWMAGLKYEGQFKSAKLAGQTQLGLSLTQPEKINKLGLLLAHTHASGVRFGPDFDTLDDLPLVENGEDVDPDHVWEEYDTRMIEFEGDWDTDARLCLAFEAPFPCTVKAAVLNVDRRDTP